MLTENSKLKSQNHSSKGKTELKERCYDYSVTLVKFLESLPEKRNKGILCNQLLRSGTSIGANVVEAKSASSKKDFIRYYEIALKSTNETLYWIGLLRDGLNISGNEIKYLLNETAELARIIASSLITLKNR